MIRPERNVGLPHLQIDQDGTAKVVFPGRTRKTGHVRDIRRTLKRRRVENSGLSRFVLDNRASLKFQDALSSKPGKPRPLLAQTDIHLRIGRHRESYLRTKLPEPENDRNESKIVKAEEATVDTAAALEGGPEPADRLGLHSTRTQGHTQHSDPVDGNVSSSVDQILVRYGPANVPAPDTLGLSKPQLQPSVEERARIEQLQEKHHGKDRVDQAASIPVLPPVVFMKRADGYTRLRYAVEILTVNGEKYVKIDETQFLYAVNADYLETGDNMTIRRAPYRHWQPNRRSGRPEVLFVLYPEGGYAYTAENGRRKKAPYEFRPQCDNFGRVVLNALDRPLKFSNIMPLQVSTEIDGWEMEAICRLDPDVCHQDFIDRMLPNEALHGKVRPTKGTLNHRRRRDRMKMRVLPWPLPRQLTYSDQQVVKELDQWQIENNTTAGLRDLRKEEIEMQEAIMYGGHFERSGANNALNDRSRLQQMKTNLGLVRTKFDEGSQEVRMVRDRITSLQLKMGVAVGAT